MQKERQTKTLAMFSGPDYWLILAALLYTSHQWPYHDSWLTEKEPTPPPGRKNPTVVVSSTCRPLQQTAESLSFSSGRQQSRGSAACLPAKGAAARSICTLYNVQVPRSQEGTKLKLGVMSKWGMIPSQVIALSD